MENVIVKTYKDWKGDIQSYLNIDDVVDEEMVNHFLNCLPPITFHSDFIQAGGCVDFLNGRNTYYTFVKENGLWHYKGDCIKGYMSRN